MLLDRSREIVINRQMKLLNLKGFFFGHSYGDVCDFSKRASALTRQGDDLYTESAGNSCRVANVS